MPGAIVATTSSGARFVWRSMRCTAPASAAMIGRPSPQRRFDIELVQLVEIAGCFDQRARAARHASGAALDSPRTRFAQQARDVAGAFAAISLNSSRERVPNGCGMTAIGRSGDARAPLLRASQARRSSSSRPSAPTLPRFATSTLSWILHDVQEPQSPDPVMTASHCRRTRSSSASGAALRRAALASLDDALDAVASRPGSRARSSTRMMEIRLGIVDEADHLSRAGCRASCGDACRCGQTRRHGFVHQHAARHGISW